MLVNEQAVKSISESRSHEDRSICNKRGGGSLIFLMQTVNYTWAKWPRYYTLRPVKKVSFFRYYVMWLLILL